MVLVIFAFNLFSQRGSDTGLVKPNYKQGVNYKFKTSAGTTHYGFVVFEDEKFVLVENKKTMERIELRKSEIISAEVLPVVRNYNSEEEDNPHAGNYLFTSSAFLFEEGRGVSTAHWFVFENIEYAFTDNWALTANSFAFYPISIGSKCAFKLSDYDHIGASAFAMGNPLGRNNSNNSLFWCYSALIKYTRGNTNKNFTLSTGILGLNSDFTGNVTSKPFVNLLFASGAYCNRFSKNWAVNVEGWYFPEAITAIGGLGLKYIADDRNCWSFGCFTFFENTGRTPSLNYKTIPIPYIGVSRKFN